MNTPSPTKETQKKHITPGSLPIELIVNVFSQLPSFSDVISLSATCRFLQEVWTNSTTPIYKQVASRSIPCERHARGLLVDQGGFAIRAAISTRDFHRMVHNSKIVENAIVQFEERILKWVRCPGVDIKETFGPDKTHPLPHLTRAERSRFIRAYYRLWGMMGLGLSEQNSRLDSMTLKQLYHLHEISKLLYSIGDEEVIRPFKLFGRGPDSMHVSEMQQNPDRDVLTKKIWARIEIVHQNVHGEKAGYRWIYSKGQGYLSAIVTWRYWHESMKMELSRLWLRVEIPTDDFGDPELRDDSSADESDS